MTRKDIAIIFAIEQKVDGLHFLCKNTSRFKDLQDLMKILIIKFRLLLNWNAEALENIDKIVAYWCLMVARGDLGVELPAWSTFVQKLIHSKQKMARIQLLLLPNDGTMITSLTPRAEVNERTL
jgi:pyruvate kinase